MSRFEVLITEPAAEDLQALMEQFIKVRRDDTLIRCILADLEKAYDNLSLRPFSYSLVNDEKLVTAGIRKLELATYVIFFIASEKDKNVTLLRILGEQRIWTDLL